MMAPPVPTTPAPSDPAARLAKAKTLLGGARVATAGFHLNMFLSDAAVKDSVKQAGGKLSAVSKATVLLVGLRPPDDTGAFDDCIRAARERGALIAEGDVASEVVGAPLFVERLTGRLKNMGQKNDKNRALKYWHVGEPATPAALAAAEARIGMPLDPALRRLYEQANGLTFGYRSFQKRDKIADRVVTRVPGPYTSELFLGPSYAHDLWDGEPGTVTACTLNIPPIEELFTRHRLLDVVSNGPVKVGSKTCAAEEASKRLFLFDAHNAYSPVFLYLDREANTMELVVGSDYGVSFGDFPSCSVGTYLDCVEATTLGNAQFGARYVDRGYTAG